MASEGTTSMSGLQSSWDCQQKKEGDKVKTKSTSKTPKRGTRPAGPASKSAVPRYMQSTEAVRLRQNASISSTKERKGSRSKDLNTRPVLSNRTSHLNKPKSVSNESNITMTTTAKKPATTTKPAPTTKPATTTRTATTTKPATTTRPTTSARSAKPATYTKPATTTRPTTSARSATSTKPASAKISTITSANKIAGTSSSRSESVSKTGTRSTATSNASEAKAKARSTVKTSVDQVKARSTVKTSVDQVKAESTECDVIESKPKRSNQKRPLSPNPNEITEKIGSTKRRKISEDVHEQTTMEIDTIITVPKRDKSSTFAPSGTEFTFRKSFPSTPYRATSGQPNLMTIEEQNSGGSSDEVFKEETVLPLTADKMTTPCRYEALNSILQHKLSAKIRNAKSPEERIKLLSQSPMIELQRKKNTSWRSSPVPSLDLEGDNHATNDADQGGPKKDLQYFKDMVLDNTIKLESQAQHWDDINKEIEVSEEVHGEIRTTSCQARLIIAERFKQFSGLIVNCETKTGEQPVLEADLDGFWDMIYVQVKDVLRKFEQLVKLQSAGWKAHNSPTLPKKVTTNLGKKKVVKQTRPKGTSKFAAFKAKLKNEATSDSNTQLENPVPSVKAEDNVETDVLGNSFKQTPERTYSFRKATVENLLQSSLKRLPSTPAPEEFKCKNVSVRSVSNKKRKSTRFSCTSTPAVQQPTVSSSSQAQDPCMSTTASPDMNQYFPSSASRLSSRFSQVKHRKHCSPSAVMVRAILSASKSGKKSNFASPLCAWEERNSQSHDGSLSEYLPNAPHPLKTPNSRKRGRHSTSHSLHKQLITKNKTPGSSLPEDPSPSMLAGTPAQNIVNDLVVFTPQQQQQQQQTPQNNGPKPLITPRRSVRVARQQRLSLL